MVKAVAKKSMQKAVDELHALPEYSTKGEVGIVVSFILVFCILCVIQWVMTNARHYSTSNAYNTRVSCLSGR